MNKIYKLLKDLPDGAKAGDRYVWDDKQERYTNNKTCYIGHYVIWKTDTVEKDTTFFQLQQPKEEQPKRIEVDEIGWLKDNEHGTWYTFSTNNKIHPLKYEAVKKAIERTLNNEITLDEVVQDYLKGGSSYYCTRPIPENKQPVEDKENKWTYSIRKGDTFKGQKVTNVYTEHGIIFFDTEKQLETQSTSNKSITCTNEEKKAEKPPIGLMPLWLWKEQRLQAVSEAIERCKEAGKEIPQVWIDEKYLLTIK